MTVTDWRTRAADAERMWFGRADAELAEHEREQLAEAKATVERIRHIQRLRAEVRRTETEHKQALEALADAAADLVLSSR